MIRTYDPGKVVMTFGPILMSGFADNSMIRVELNEDSFTLQMSADGHGTRVASNNKSGKLTVSLMQTSMANDLLSAVYQLDDKARAGVFPVLLKDNSGRSIIVAESAWITRLPPTEFGKTAGAREWVLESDKIEAFIGGN